jgi:hypothetical protein
MYDTFQTQCTRIRNLKERVDEIIPEDIAKILFERWKKCKKISETVKAVCFAIFITRFNRTDSE